MRFFRFLTLFVSFAFPCAVIAQTTNASLTGFADDPSKAVIPNVSITAINTETGVKTQTFTNSSGQYVLPALPPGSYRIEVDKEGFKGIIEGGLILHVQDIVQMNFHMAIGSSSETVTVNAGGLQLNTTDASVSTVIDSNFVANIPLNGRSFQDLIAMTPGVVTQSPQTTGQGVGYSGDFSVNGQRTESNYYAVDGVAGNVNSGYPNGYAQAATGGTIAGGTALGTTQSLISVDALQEFRVESSTYSAEYGRAPGAQVIFTTRSGTDDLHGSAFDYLRNNYFDANDWFNDHYGVPISALRQNDFGGTVGGPILLPHIYNGKNRTFFFGSYEGLRLAQPQPATLEYVPSISLRQSAPGTIAPILNAFPVATGPEVQIPCDGVNTPCLAGQPVGSLAPSGLAPFLKSYSLPSQIDSTSIRLDHTFTPRLATFFRFGITPSSVATRNLASLDQNQSDTQTYTVGTTLQISQRATNELRLGYSRVRTALQFMLDTFGGAVPINLANAMGIGGYSNPSSDFYINIGGVGSTQLETETAANKGAQWNLVDSTSILLGHHQLKFGADYRRITSPLIPASPYVFPYYSSREAIASDSSTFTSIEKFIGATPIFNETSVYAQDNWRVATRLTLSYGLRWEVDPPPVAANGDGAYTLSGSISDPSALTLAPQGTPLWKTTWYNFAPRLGIAWQAHDTPGWETVLRAGGGVFFDSDNELATQGYTGGIGFFASEALYGVSVSLTPAQLSLQISTAPPYTNTTINAFPPHLQLPYTLQWNGALEQSLGRSQSLTLSYVASNGRRLFETQEIYLTPFNPDFGYITYFPNGNTSNYQSLQAKFQRTVSRGLQALASYTWSHSIDFGSNDSSFPYTRGNSDFDVRQNFQAGVNWDIPSPRNPGVPQMLLGQWGLDTRVMARSGFPITLDGQSALDPATGVFYNGGVDLIPGRPLYLYGSQYPGGRALNGGPNTSSATAAFILPAGVSAGNAPRNLARGFSESQVNLAARRTFNLHEALKLQFRAETFNVFNHPNFGMVDPTLTDAQFGQATDMLNQSLGTVASQYQQGGPRSMQFALKLLF